MGALLPGTCKLVFETSFRITQYKEFDYAAL